MPRRLPTLPLAVGLAVLFFVATRPARGEPDGQVTVAVPAQEYQQVEIDLEGGGTVEGVLKLQAVPLRTDTGSRVIDIQHVRRVTFQRDPQGKSEDLVELTTKEVVRGRVTADSFPVEPTGAAVKSYPKAELREVRVKVDKPHSLAAILLGLLTLTVMEIVLGVDNVIFLAIVSARLPKEEQPKARRIGLAAALGTRLLLLFSLTFLLGLTAPVFTLPDMPLVRDLEAREVSWRDIILFGGGLFLIGKSVYEIHEKVEHAKAHHETGTPPAGGTASFAKVIATIAVIDIVFSLDSVITAVGMVDQLWVMIVAMVIAMGVMLVFAGPISDFVDRHPTVKVLALAFLILIGVMLVAEGLGQHMNKGYIYFAMAFAVVIEFINMKLRGPGKAAGKPHGVGERPTVS